MGKDQGGARLSAKKERRKTEKGGCHSRGGGNPNHIDSRLRGNDNTHTMFNPFKKTTEEISRTTPGYEETERRTPITGIILLLLMFVAGLYFGIYAMRDVANIPNRPQSLSLCAYHYQKKGSTIAAPAYLGRYDDMLEEYSFARNTSADCLTRLSIFEKDGQIAPLLEQRTALEVQVRPAYLQLRDTVLPDLLEVQAQIGRVTGEYGVGLQEESMDIKSPVFPTADSRQSIPELRAQEGELLQWRGELEGQLNSVKGALKALDAQLTAAYTPVFKAHERALRWYEFQVFLLQFLLLVPFFFLALRKYLELHRKNSPYSVILTAIVAVFGILLLKAVLFWFWGLFLERILNVLIEWFSMYDLFRSLLFYVGMFLSFAIFGGAVYFLQKKIFDPRRVTIRRFRAKQCPQCQTNLDLSAEYCPNCGAHIRTTCEKCGKDRFAGMPFCPHCGDRKDN